MKNKILIILLMTFIIPLTGCIKQRGAAEIVPGLKGTGIVLPGITAVAFCGANGAFFAAGTGEGSLFIWDINRGRRIRAIRAGDSAVTSAAFSADGKFIAAKTSSGQVTVWDFLKDESADADAVLVTTVSADEIFANVLDVKFNQNKGSLQVVIENDRHMQIAVKDKITAATANKNSTRLLTGCDEGIVRLWNMETAGQRFGEEIARYISFGAAEGNEWISLLPSGYYNASAGGDSLMKVESGGETFTMSQFANALFRPDLHSKAVREGGSAPQETLQTLLAPENTPPLVEIMGSKSLNVNEGSAQVRVKITAGAGGVGRMKVVRAGAADSSLVGYMAINGLIQRQYEKKNKHIYEIAFNVPLEPGKNTIGVSVFGERRKRESKTAYVAINTNWAGEKADKPDLHVLLTSIETYKNAGRGGIGNLRFTTDDADAIGEMFEEQKKGSLYRDVKIYQYADNEITKEGFGKIFAETAAKVGRNDSFVFFFAGHGFVDNMSGDFFFIPWDSVGFFDNPMENNIVMDDIIGGITSVHAKNSLMLLDTCQSGTLLESGDTAFEKLVRQLNQKAIITATMGNQDALESKLIGHGIFTASLLDSYQYRPEEQFSTVADVIAFTKTDVPDKFAKIMRDAAARGMKVEAEPQTQRPLSFLPKENFNVFDKYTEPGLLEIRSVTAGTVSIFGMPDETAVIGAGRALEKRLAGGTYHVSIEYADKHMETKDVIMSNAPKSTGMNVSVFKPQKNVISFDYRPAASNPARAAPVVIPPPPPEYDGYVLLYRDNIEVKSDKINLGAEELERFKDYVFRHAKVAIVRTDNSTPGRVSFSANYTLQAVEPAKYETLEFKSQWDEGVYQTSLVQIPITREMAQLCIKVNEFIKYGGGLSFCEASRYCTIELDMERNSIFVFDDGP